MESWKRGKFEEEMEKFYAQVRRFGEVQDPRKKKVMTNIETQIYKNMNRSKKRKSVTAMKEKGVIYDVVTDTTIDTGGNMSNITKEHDLVLIDQQEKQDHYAQVYNNNERVYAVGISQKRPFVQVNDIKKNIVGASQEGILDSSKLPQKRVGIDISFEELEEVSSLKRKDAAQKLNVSVSTFKRVCRHYHIPRWPPHKRNIDHPSHFGNFAQTASTKEMGVPTMQNDSLVTIKAKYGDIFIKFELLASTGIDSFNQQVSKRLKLDVAKYIVKYQDNDNDWILVACDEDLKDYISRSISLGKTFLIIWIEHI